MQNRDRQSLADMLGAARKLRDYAQGTSRETLPTPILRSTVDSNSWLPRALLCRGRRRTPTLDVGMRYEKSPRRHLRNPALDLCQASSSP